GWSWPTGAPTTEAKALYERTARQIRFGTLAEQLPDPANRITPDPAQRDQLGIPRPRIAYRIDDYTKAGLAEARAIHEAAFKRLGTTEISHKDDQHFQGAGHVMGT